MSEKPRFEDWERYKARMDEPVYMRPHIKQVMAEALAKQMIVEEVHE